MTPEQLLNSFQQAPALRDKSFLHTAFAARKGLPMDTLTPKEAFSTHVRVWTMITDALTEEQVIALFNPIEETPVYFLDDVIDKYAEHHKTTARLYAEQNFAAVANDEYGDPPEPMTEEEKQKLKQGWKTIDEAKRSGTLAEQIYAKALEIALTEIFLKRQENAQVLSR